MTLLTEREKRLILSRFMKMIADVKNLIGVLRLPRSDETDAAIQKFISDIEAVVDYYWLNFDVCQHCGQPIPEAPSVADHKKLEFLLSQYLETYEIKTSTEINILNEDDSDNRESSGDPVRISLPESIKRFSRSSKKLDHFRGTLVKIS